jgi:DNA-binding GntR family transcriptional regulator
MLYNLRPMGQVPAEDVRNVVSYSGRPPTLSEHVARHVRGLILSGHVHQGDFLRLERLARDLDVSVTPVREALMALRSEGFVTLEPNRGFAVARLSQRDVYDMFLVKAQVAEELAARAARLVTPEMLASLVAIQDAFEDAARTHDLPALEALNDEFHSVINDAAESPKLSFFYSAASYGATLPLELWDEKQPARQSHVLDLLIEPSLVEHHAIIEALKRRDAEGARSAMREHLLHGGEVVIEHLQRTEVRSEDRTARPAGLATS